MANKPKQGLRDERDPLLVRLQVDRLPLAYILLDAEHRILEWNPAAEKMFGFAFEEARGRICFELLDAGPLEQIRDIIRRVEAGAMDAHSINECRTKDGRVICCQWFNTPLKDADGRFSGVISLAQDITERRGTERMLEESRVRFQAVFENALHPILIFNDDLYYVEINPIACNLVGYTRDELLHMTAVDLTPEEDRAKIFDIFKRFISDGNMSGEYRLLCKNGMIRDIEFHAVAHFLPGLHLAIFRDITERKVADEKLKTNAVLLAEAQRIAHVGSWNWNLSTGSVQWSDECYRIFGLRPQEIDISHERFLALVHPEDRIAVDRVIKKRLIDHQPIEMRLRALHRDGTIRHLLSRGRISLDEHNQPVRMYGIILDVTELHLTEEALRESAERLQILSHRVVEIQEAERRHLAHELHDEIGQVLSAIAVNLQAMKDTSEESTRSRLDESINLVEHATQQVRNLSLDLRPSMLDDLGLISTLRWYADRQAQRAGFVLHFSAESTGDRIPPELEIACYRIVQEALTNIVRHAHAKEVWVTVAVREEEIELVVHDNGIGFDLSSALTRAARGASFGVRGMKDRIELLGGQFEIESKPGRETKIRVFLPVSNS